MTTPKLGMPELSVSQASKEITHNQALAILDQTSQLTVVSRTNTPPGSPTNGAAYIVTATATGAWTGKESQIAFWLSSVGAWQFIVAANGWLAWSNADSKTYRRESGSWVELASGGGSFTGGTLSTALNEPPPATVASASTTNIGAADRNTVNITGTATITAFDTIASGATRRLIFGGVLTLTHNATTLILPTGANITTAAGDVAEFLSLGSGNWRCVDYTRANGQALVGSGSFTGGTLTSALNEATPVSIASASTVNIGAAAANTVSITGTTTITAFDTIASGATRRLIFAGALTLTHNATSLILPTAANITTAAGDVAEFISLGSGNWRCIDYTRANGQALAGSSSGNLTQTVSSSSGVLNLSSTTAETLMLTTSENVTSISWPSGVAGQSIQRRLVVTQGGAGSYTLPSTTANWGSITVDGGGSIPQPSTGVGAVTNYFLVNDNNTGWRMFLDESLRTGGTLSGALNEAPLVTLASASTVNIGAAAANTISITGTTTITAFDTIAAGAKRKLIFGGALVLTHNATSLILPGGANITTAANDTAELVSLGSGNWRCTDYMRAASATVVLGTAATASVTTSTTDTTADAVLQVNDFGVGALALNSTNLLTDLNSTTLPSGTYAYGAGATGAPNAGPGTLVVQRFSNSVSKQIARTVNGSSASDLTYERQVRSTGPTYEDWVPLGAASYTNLTLTSPYIWDSAGDAANYHQPSYTRVGDVVRLRGKVTLPGTHTTNATVNNTTIATLPVGYRPTKRKAFIMFWDTDSPLHFAYCMIFVNADGTIVLISPSPTQPYPFTEGHILLEQIWFDLAS